MARAAGSAGVIYDHFGFYAPAFAAGLGVNIINLTIIGALALRKSQFAPA